MKLKICNDDILSSKRLLLESGAFWQRKAFSNSDFLFAASDQKAFIGYLYKENLQISILCLNDDITGVTDVGYKAQQMKILLLSSLQKRVYVWGEQM